MNLDMKMAKSCADFIKRQIDDFVPNVGIILGSGLGDVLNNAELVASVEYNDIPDFPCATVSGHKGRFLFLKYANKNVVAMQGRVHYYEGYSIHQTVLPICVMKLLGIDTLIITNASGGVNPKFEAGDIMVIEDHISNFVPSPLIGENDSKYGERFPDMSSVYNRDLNNALFEIADKNNIELKRGVYLQTTGPNYETPAEVRMFSVMGADAVGMSTACEAITANYLGIKICGLSVVTNKAVGLNQTPLSHTEVQQIAESATEKLRVILDDFIYNMAL